MQNIKYLLFDIDGVVILPRKKYFSEKFAEEQNLELDQVLPFFKGEYKESAIGKVDMKAVLPPYLSKWGWKDSLENFLKYWFESEKDPDTQLLKLIDNLREKGIKSYLASNNEKNRADYLMQVVGLKDHFDGGFYSYDFGVTKSDIEFFKKVISELKCKPEEVAYWDSDQKNIEVAKLAGIRGFVYKDYSEIISDLNQLVPEVMTSLIK